MEPKEIIGLDVGHKRTGIARASSMAKIAEPLKTVPTDKIFEELGEMAKSGKVETIVVGLPRNLSGDDTTQTTWVREWVVRAKQKINAQFFWQDEALSSKLAEAGKPGLKKPGEVDALAAAIILQDFVDTPELERVLC